MIQCNNGCKPPQTKRDTIVVEQETFEDRYKDRFLTEEEIKNAKGEFSIRTEGEFKGIGFILSKDFLWAIRRDSRGSIVLIPLKEPL